MAQTLYTNQKRSGQKTHILPPKLSLRATLISNNRIDIKRATPETFGSRNLGKC